MSEAGPHRDLRRTAGSFGRALWAAAALTVLMVAISFHHIGAPRAAAREAGASDSRAADRLLMILPRDLRETSGVAVSRANPGVFWTHNDSGDRPVVYGVLPEEGRILEFDLQGASARDWEDIDLANCPFPSDRECLYIGDIGDNFSRRSSVSILVFEEPVVRRGQHEGTDVAWMGLKATYEDGARDSEALAVDDEGNLFLVSKGREGRHGVYSIDSEDLPAGLSGASTVLSARGELPVTPSWFVGRAVTGGTFVNGELVVRTYTEIYFHGSHQGDWTLSREPCFVGHLGAGGEGLDVGDDGLFYLTQEATGRRPAALHEVSCPPGETLPPQNARSSRSSSSSF